MARAVVQIVADHDDVDRYASNGREKFPGIRGCGYDLQTAIIAQGFRQELRVYARAVGDDNADKIRSYYFLMGGHPVS